HLNPLIICFLFHLVHLLTSLFRFHIIHISTSHLYFTTQHFTHPYFSFYLHFPQPFPFICVYESPFFTTLSPVLFILPFISSSLFTFLIIFEYKKRPLYKSLLLFYIFLFLNV